MISLPNLNKHSVFSLQLSSTSNNINHEVEFELIIQSNDLKLSFIG